MMVDGRTDGKGKNRRANVAGGTPLARDCGKIIPAVLVRRPKSNVACWPRLCENAKTLNEGRTSRSFKTTLGVHTASLFNFEVELENIILGAF
jgi:hypothetical protein